MRLIKNFHKEYLPAKIFLNCLNHMSQWSSLKLIRSSVESFNLFCSFFKHMKRVIPNKVPLLCCLIEQRRFSLTENMSLSSTNSSLCRKSYLESPEKKLKFRVKTIVFIFLYVWIINIEKTQKYLSSVILLIMLYVKSYMRWGGKKRKIRSCIPYIEKNGRESLPHKA